MSTESMLQLEIVIFGDFKCHNVEWPAGRPVHKFTLEIDLTMSLRLRELSVC